MAVEVGLFGRIAIEKGLVTESQLESALRAQEELRALGLPRQLGQLLVQDGVLKPDQVTLICRLQQMNEQAQFDKRFARIAVKNGLATQDQVDSALEAARDGGFQLTLGGVLVERGILTPVAVRAIRSAMERTGTGAPEGVAPGAPAGPTTARLGAALLVEPESAPDLGVEKRIRDVLFAAVALRDGRVLVPELERALRNQASMGAEQPLLETVLASRGILPPAEIGAISSALEVARAEKLTIPGYRITDVLGRGATSIVLRARHEMIDREVAIKLFRTEQVEATDVDALVEEARTIAKLRHPNIVGLYDVGRVHRRVYYVMELVDGPTLQETIRERGPLPEREVLERARDVASALDAVHAAGLVHRDVKPLNILLARTGEAKLTDLGLAREGGKADSDLTNTASGTPQTIAPEQVQGETVDIRADLYGLGATLFMALTGRAPFEGGQALGIMLRHVTDDVPDPRTLRPELTEPTAALVMRLMAKRPEDRPPHPHQVVGTIEKILAETKRSGLAPL
jgi:tRNA A-37 threonylcarbamoyl transferase component Bud32